MTKMFLIVAVCLIYSGFAKAELDADPIKGSLSSVKQDEALADVIANNAGADAKKLARELNKKLKEFGLPLIDAESSQLSFTPASINTPMKNVLIGGEMRDGKNRFCLPCTQGYNSFVSGIMPTKGSSGEKSAAKKEQLKNFLGECKYNLEQTETLPIPGGQCNGVASHVCNMSAKCVNGADQTETTGSCFAPGGKCPADPLDCLSAKIDCVAATKLTSKGAKPKTSQENAPSMPPSRKNEAAQ